MRWLLLPLIALSCGGMDADNDGLTNAEEKELGTSPSYPDTDRDGLLDGEEVNEHGTDPLEKDTDRDGFEDAEEVDAGSNPTDPLDYPDTRWPDGSARIPEDEARAWTLGEHAPNWRGTDQHGDRLDLDQLYGHVIVLQLVAGDFCPACATTAADAKTLYAARKDQGLYVVHVLVDDDTRDGEVEAGFAATWAERHAVDFPVVVSPGAAGDLFDAGLYDGRIPLTILLDRGHRMQGSWQGGDGIDQVAEELVTVLSQPVP